ncbi:hypothetical protein, partial [uncultured Mailhella sp.]|uniref:hypothetical protein n=1 Tax=uncultured Mailhella sp. TaxID=1981031 RepID=UPI0025F1D5C9
NYKFSGTPSLAGGFLLTNKKCPAGHLLQDFAGREKNLRSHDIDPVHSQVSGTQHKGTGDDDFGHRFPPSLNAGDFSGCGELC